MSLVIRLARIGKKGERKYQIVVREKRSRRDGRPVAILGSFERARVKSGKDLDKKAIDAWVAKGAQISEGLRKILQ